MLNNIKIYTLIAIVSMHSCNWTVDTKLIKYTGTAILSGYTAHGLIDKFSLESRNNRSNTVKQILQDDPRADLCIKNINNTLDKVLHENVRFYWALSPFLDKEFIKKDDSLNKKEKQKNKSSKRALEKAIDTIIKPTTDKIKKTIGNAALIAGPTTGVYLAFTAKAHSKNVFLVTKNIALTMAIVGVSTGVATNVSLHFIDKNLPKICDLGMNTYTKIEPIVLNEVANLSHNILQITKDSLKETTPLHSLIKEQPMKETQFFVMNTEVMKPAIHEYYTTMYNIAIEECFRFPIQIARYLPPVTIDADIINRTTPTPLQEALDRYLSPVKINRKLYSKNN